MLEVPRGWAISNAPMLSSYATGSKRCRRTTSRTRVTLTECAGAGLSAGQAVAVAVSRISAGRSEAIPRLEATTAIPQPAIAMSAIDFPISVARMRRATS